MSEHFEQLTDLVKGLAVMGELTPRATDAISAYGERLSSIIVTARFNNAGINAAHLDAREVLIVTDRRHMQAAPLFPETNGKLAASIPALMQAQVSVMGGFIASTGRWRYNNVGPRRRSDYTASIVGAGIGAEEIQIWTDVDGIHADRRSQDSSRRTSRRNLLLRRSRRTRLLWRESATPSHRPSGD